MQVVCRTHDKPNNAVACACVGTQCSRTETGKQMLPFEEVSPTMEQLLPLTILSSRSYQTEVSLAAFPSPDGKEVLFAPLRLFLGWRTKLPRQGLPGKFGTDSLKLTVCCTGDLFHGLSNDLDLSKPGLNLFDNFIRG